MVSGATKTRARYLGHPNIGLFTSPLTGGGRVDDLGLPWASDNDCFSGRFDAGRYVRFLAKNDPSLCKFVTCPDVVSDASATLELYHYWAPIIRALGFPAAFVLQNNQSPEAVPQCEALFVGGDTAWKYSDTVRTIVRALRPTGVWVHWGRVNSARRMRYAYEVGADSFDGTITSRWPDRWMKWMLDHTKAVSKQGALF